MELTKVDLLNDLIATKNIPTPVNSFPILPGCTSLLHHFHVAADMVLLHHKKMASDSTYHGIEQLGMEFGADIKFPTNMCSVL